MQILHRFALFYLPQLRDERGRAGFLQKADRLSERQAEERFRKLCADDIAITALSDIESTQTEWLWYPTYRAAR